MAGAFTRDSLNYTILAVCTLISASMRATYNCYTRPRREKLLAQNMRRHVGENCSTLLSGFSFSCNSRAAPQNINTQHVTADFKAFLRLILSSQIAYIYTRTRYVRKYLIQIIICLYTISLRSEARTFFILPCLPAVRHMMRCRNVLLYVNMLKARQWRTI